MAVPSPAAVSTAPAGAPTGPARAGWVLGTLILVASVANLNLAVANVALPDIGADLNASQTGLNLVSVGFSLGLAGTVLYLGALGDRYGRKGMLLLGMALTIPTALLATWAPSIGVLFLARVLGGVAAGMAYPTTLALITALWAGPARTRSIALWSAVGGGMVAVASLLAGWLLTTFWWGSVFFLTAPLAAVALVLAARYVPAHVNETDDTVDHVGGALSVVGVVAVVMAINFAPSPGEGTTALVAGAVAVVAFVGFFVRQARARTPLFDLHVAARRVFWVAAVAGLVVFGTLMGAVFVGEQYLQNVLGYSTLAAGAAVLPAAVAMVVAAPVSAKLIGRVGSRLTLLTGYAFLLAAFVVMLLWWTASAGYGPVAAAFILMGIGVGLSGTPASHSLTGSVPTARAGMASGTADLQRDLGGSIMQSILGAILTAGYAAAVANRIATSGAHPTDQVTTLLERSFSSAAAVAQAHPAQASAILAGARASFLDGADWAYAAGALAIVVGALLVAACFPSRAREAELLAGYEREDRRP
ncbi:MAG TPA: MFS transporter [Acidimicrobiales bacterium]|nr:MFS transporter [Acidimicrobiales bacterium]